MTDNELKPLAVERLMTDEEAQDCARAIVHVVSMFAMTDPSHDYEFRYVWAEEVRASRAENAHQLAEAVRDQIDREYPDKRHPI